MPSSFAAHTLLYKFFSITNHQQLLLIGLEVWPELHQFSALMGRVLNLGAKVLIFPKNRDNQRCKIVLGVQKKVHPKYGMIYLLSGKTFCYIAAVLCGYDLFSLAYCFGVVPYLYIFYTSATISAIRMICVKTKNAARVVLAAFML